MQQWAGCHGPQYLLRCSCRGISITDSAVVDLGTYHVEVFSLSIGANANFDCSIFLEIVNCDLVVLFQTQLLGGAKVFDRVCLVVPTFIISRKGQHLRHSIQGRLPHTCMTFLKVNSTVKLKNRPKFDRKKNSHSIGQSGSKNFTGIRKGATPTPNTLIVR